MSMLENARAYVNEHEKSLNIHPSYKFLQASAEDLRTALPDDSVDLLIAGTYLVLICLNDPLRHYSTILPLVRLE
jgi:hypothetical protein